MIFKQKLVYMVLGAIITSFGLSLLIGCGIKEFNEFNISNTTEDTIHYQIKWTDRSEWQPHSLKTGSINTHRFNAPNVSASYPKIRFDYIVGDQSVTYRTYPLETVLSSEGNSSAALKYSFRFGSRNELDIYKVENGVPPPPPPRYSPLKPPVKLSHVDSVKWLRDHGYSVETNNQTYIIKGPNTNLNVSVGATVIVPVYDKFSMSVGLLSIDGKISVTINRQRRVNPVN